MKTNDVFPSKYLKAEDDVFDNGDFTVTVKSVVLEKLTSREKGEEDKPVMYFNELDKGLILNKTNWGVCAKLFDEESDNWAGERVTLFTMDVDAFGDIVSAIRIRNKKPKSERAALVSRFEKLAATAVELKVEGAENYVITDEMPDSEIIALGIELKAKVEAAKEF